MTEIMTDEHLKMLDEIFKTWHSDQGTLPLAAFHIGYLMGLIATLEGERQRLLGHLADASAPE